MIDYFKSVGASISNVAVSHRNKETGFAVRSVKLVGASIDVFTDPKLRLDAIATCSGGKEVQFSATSPDSPNNNTSGVVDVVSFAAGVARDMGLSQEEVRLLAARDDGSSLEAIADSTRSIFRASTDKAAEIRKLVNKQARELMNQKETEPPKKATPKKEAATV